MPRTQETLSFGSRTPQRRWWLPALVVLVPAACAAVILVVLGHRGTPASRAAVILSADSSSQVETNTGTRQSSYTFPLLNLGGGEATITRVGRSGPGLRLVGVRVLPGAGPHLPGLPGDLPVVIEGHGTVEVTLTYQVLSCRTPPPHWPVPVTIRTAAEQHPRTVLVAPAAAVRGGAWYHDLTRGMCGQPG